MAAGDSNPAVNDPNQEQEFFQRWKRKPTFTTVDLVLTAVSLITYFLDLATDLALAAQYLQSGHLDWSIMTFLLSFLPLLVIQCISLRWLAVDDLLCIKAWISHCFLLGVGYRYYLLMETGNEAQRENTPLAFQRYYHHQNDVCMLRLFESFMESAPQLLLQLHIMAQMESWNPWTIACALASTASLGWGIATYGKAMRNTRPDKEALSWTGLILQAFWRGGAVGARLVALLLLSLVLHEWMPLAMGCHWFAMTWWIVTQKTDFCSTWWEEKVYNAIVGVIYCFCFFNLKEGPSRTKAATFDVIAAMENVACVFVFLRFYDQGSEWFMRIAPMVVALASFIGLISQLIYYRWFHPSGPKDIACWDANKGQDAESPSSCKSNGSGLGTLRSLKFAYGPRPLILIEAAVPSSKGNTPLRDEDLHVGINHALNLDDETTLSEKSDHPSPPQEVIVAAVELNHQTASSAFHEVQETPKTTKRVSSGPKRDDDYEEIQDITPTNSQETKKCNDIPMRMEEKLLTQAPPLDTESVTSERMSTHEYENMPSANINRTDWGVRHWSTYPDIQENIHDYSTCYEREMLDSTFTSTATSENYSTVKQIQEDSVRNQSTNNTPLLEHIHANLDSSAHNQLCEFIWDADSQETPANSFHVTIDYAQKPQLSVILEETELSSNVSLSNQSLRTKNTSRISIHSNASKPQSIVSTNSSPASTQSFQEQESTPNFIRKSSSSLVHTVEEVMNESLCNVFYPSMSELFILYPPPPNSPVSPSESSKYSEAPFQAQKLAVLPSTPENQEDLTYVEVSFLSKLSDLAPNNTPVETPRVRRNFSVLRDMFNSPSAIVSPKESPKLPSFDKENILRDIKKPPKDYIVLSPFSPVNLLRAPNVTLNSSMGTNSFCTTPPPPLLPRTPLRRTTLSPNSKIFQKS